MIDAKRLHDANLVNCTNVIESSREFDAYEKKYF